VLGEPDEWHKDLVRIAGLRDCPKLASEKHPLHLKQWSRPGLNALKAYFLYQNLETPHIPTFVYGVNNVIQYV
jgi:hypothetical protein